MSFTGVCLLLSRRVVVVNSSGISLTVSPYTTIQIRKANGAFVLSMSHLIDSSLYQILTYEIVVGTSVVPLSLLVISSNESLQGLESTSINPTQTSLVFTSVEGLWPSASWQEREVSEMFGISYANKRDARSLFTSSLNKLHPLCKSTPTSGFYELSRVGGSLAACRLEVA